MRSEVWERVCRTCWPPRPLTLCEEDEEGSGGEGGARAEWKDAPSANNKNTHSTTVQWWNQTSVYSHPHYLLPDTNVVLHQIDFLEDPAITNVILLQVVLQEVKHQNIGVYKRIRDVASNPEKRLCYEHHRETSIVWKHRSILMTSGYTVVQLCGSLRVIIAYDGLPRVHDCTCT